jgi:hypothetical protein
MNGFARYLAIVLLAVFAVGTVAHAAAVPANCVSISLTGDANSGLCPQGCPGGSDNFTTCDQNCVLPLLAISTDPIWVLEVFAPIFAVAPEADLSGRSKLPDPYPPKPIILI